MMSSLVLKNESFVVIYSSGKNLKIQMIRIDFSFKLYAKQAIFISANTLRARAKKFKLQGVLKSQEKKQNCIRDYFD